ncbi:hypothetical protein PSAN_24490 [Pseudomonas antarctica]|uniref:Transposase DDE domain-containing protein n=1 Tax=Pseudomonas antarctica TaxID=219572 RepID=A0ABQ7A0F4_9PSED|nr:hypothetical protein PSAN_24490 [Pseudomonas antarctica]
MAYIQGESRSQTSLLQVSLEELIPEDHLVRVIDLLMNSMGLQQFNTQESDARMMRTPKGPRVAYSVQTAVDAAHCLILHHEVTQDGDDRKQLEPMAKASKEHLEQDALSVAADAGYSNVAMSHAMPMRKPLSEWSSECWRIRR